MMSDYDRTKAINELYALGREAEDLLEKRIPHEREIATEFRLTGRPILAQAFSTNVSILERQLADIGQRQQRLMAELAAAGEGFYL